MPTPGRIRWAFDTGGRINSSPSLAQGRVCVTTYAGSIFCVRQRDGPKLWSTYVKRDAFRYESFYASASTDGERLYTIARSGKIVDARRVVGRVLWTDDVNSLGYSTPAVGSDRIFVGDFNGGLRAYRKTNGRLLWRAHVGGRILGAPVVVGDLVFFSTLETETYAARVSDGKVVWRYGARQVLAGDRDGARRTTSRSTGCSSPSAAATRGSRSPAGSRRSGIAAARSPACGGAYPKAHRCRGRTTSLPWTTRSGDRRQPDVPVLTPSSRVATPPERRALHRARPTPRHAAVFAR